MERRVGIVPYPEVAVLPSSASEAFEDLIRYIGTLYPRQQVIELVTEMDMTRLTQVGMDMIVRPPLNNFERLFLPTMQYCVNHRLIRGLVEAAGALEGVKQEVIDGGVFIGKERNTNKQRLVLE